MCGILGVIGSDISEEGFRLQLQKMEHRGPDGEGIILLANNKVALGHKRLSIIDLSNAGSQPMSNEDGSIWITFNGEIYNYKALQRELIENGHVFKSNSDTEVLIHGYEQWGGIGLLERLEGMFAFAIWDEKAERVFAARDRFGIKPFYYVHSEKRGFSFASELKSLIAAQNFDNTIDYQAIADFLVYRFIPAPRTIYSDARKLQPGHYCDYQLKTNTLVINSYWSPADYLDDKIDLNTLEIEDLLRKSIRDHLVSDVPVGVFLSGGYDSSALVHYMSDYIHNFSTFSVGFENWAKTEHHSAREVAKLYRTDHNEIILNASLQEDLSDYAYYYDEPLGGSSFMPTFKISEFAAKTHKVVLGGDGGDEIFGGYSWYYKVLRYRNEGKGRWTKWLRNSDQLLKLYHREMSWSGYDYKEANQLLNGKVEVMDDIWLYKNYDEPKASDLKRMQLIDLQTFLPDVINTKVDRASMAHSLEVRVPFLNHLLAERLLSFHDDILYQQNINKKLLRSFIEPHLPKSIIDKKKQGFGSPVNYNNSFERLLTGKLVKDGIVNREKIQGYIDRKSRSKLWPIFILENWYERWANY